MIIMRNEQSKLINVNNIETKSPFNITAEDIKVATIRFEKEGTRVMLGNPKGVAGISLLRNKYHRARMQAIDMVAATKR